jgi:tetratricopeptide (TPR) repeat protein
MFKLFLLTFFSLNAHFSYCIKDNSLKESQTLLQQTKTKEVINTLKKSLSENPNDPHILYNLGIAEYKANNLSTALGYLRHSRNLKPFSFVIYKNLKKIESKASLIISPFHSSFEEFKRNLLDFIPLSFLFFTTLLLLFIVSFYFIKFSYIRQKSFDEELPPPQLKYRFVFLSFFEVILLTLLIFKFYDYYNPRATVLKEAVVLSAPSQESSTLFKLDAGEEVVLKRTNQGWTLIEQLNGMKGWIKSDSLYQHSGKKI